MKKRLVALLLASAMVTAALAGCGAKEEKKEESKAKESSAEKSEAKEEASSDAAVSEEEEELEWTTVKILAVGDENKMDGTTVGEYFYDMLAERKIEVEIEYVDGDSYASVLNTRMASGVDIPDIIAGAWMIGDNGFLQWAADGKILPLSDLVEEYDKDGSIRAWYDQYAPGFWEMKSTTPDGKMYWFSYLDTVPYTKDADGNIVNAKAVYAPKVRQDWTQAVGEGDVKEVYSADEIFDLLVKMRENDANGNGESDEIVYVNISSFNTDNCFARLFDLNRNRIAGIKDGDTEYTANVFHENFEDYIKFMQKLYEVGLYDTAAMTTPREELIASNRVALECGTHQFFNDSQYLPNADKQVYVTTFLDNDKDLSNGAPMISEPTTGGIYHYHAIPAAAENVEGAMRLFDFIHSIDFYEINEIGIEGKGFYIDENGNYVSTTVQEDEDTWYLCRYSNSAFPNQWVMPVVEDPWRNVNMEDEVAVTNKQRYLDTQAIREAGQKNGDVIWTSDRLAFSTEEEQARISEIEETLSTYIAELLADLILGNKSLDDLEEYRAELVELGINEYIDIMNARLQRYLDAF